ncbi:MAG: UDP-N-acetylglucosamine 2-epimerase [Pirellulales bacterium]
MTARTIGVVTVGRSDFGIYLPVLRRISRDADLRLRLFVSGAHLSAAHGRTVDEIQRQGFEVHQRVQMLLADDSPAAVAQSLGLGVLSFAQAYAAEKPDILLLLGDRFEMFAAAAAAVPMRIPLAHIHGGEVTHGAIDEAFRHSISKCSHWHFTSTQEYADRLIRMGEEPWRVTVSGAPALDNLHTIELPTYDELAREFDLPAGRPLLVTFHPVTLQFEDVRRQIDELLAALAGHDGPIVFTAPNADTYGQIVAEQTRRFVAQRANCRYVENLGVRRYFGFMRHAAAMIGNSSSGIIEAASFELPVVNIGIRQAGRAASRNVLHVGNERHEIEAGLKKALHPDFRRGLVGLRNIYGAGDAAETIVRTLKQTAIDERLLVKRFYDGPVASQAPALRAG